VSFVLLVPIGLQVHLFVPEEKNGEVKAKPLCGVIKKVHECIKTIDGEFTPWQPIHSLINKVEKGGFTMCEQCAKTFSNIYST